MITAKSDPARANNDAAPLRADSPATHNRPPSGGPSRRQLLQVLGGLGVGSAVFQRALAAQAQQAAAVTPEMVLQAEWIAGLNLSEDDRKTTAQALQRLLENFQTLREIKLDNNVPPALSFNPAPWQIHKNEQPRGSVSPLEHVAPKRPGVNYHRPPRSHSPPTRSQP